MLRFFLDGEAVAVLVEFGHAVALGIIDIVAEDRGLPMLLGILYALLQETGEAAAIEDVVAQDETGTIIANEFFTNDEGLSQSVG